MTRSYVNCILKKYGDKKQMNELNVYRFNKFLAITTWSICFVVTCDNLCFSLVLKLVFVLVKVKGFFFSRHMFQTTYNMWVSSICLDWFLVTVKPTVFHAIHSYHTLSIWYRRPMLRTNERNVDCWHFVFYKNRKSHNKRDSRLRYTHAQIP